MARSELQGNRDLDGRLTTWLGDNAATAVLVRPHFYVFGAAASPDDLPALVDDLRVELALGQPSTTP